LRNFLVDNSCLPLLLVSVAVLNSDEYAFPYPKLEV
jgi:hypothetical protein